MRVGDFEAYETEPQLRKSSWPLTAFGEGNVDCKRFVRTMVLLPWLEDGEYQLHGTGSEYRFYEEPDVSLRPDKEGRG